MVDLNSILNPGFKSSDYNASNFTKFDYYSGSQITVWMGNILIDDISSIQWVRTQNKRPIYGYASQQFDDVAKGTVLIQGNFTVNFKQAGYLTLVMREIRKIYASTVENQQNWSTIKDLIGLHLKNGTFGPQTSQEIIDIGNSPDFASLAKIYENTIWGGGVPTTEDSQVSTDGVVAEAASAVDVLQHREIPKGFTILITYGNSSGSSARTLNDYIQSTTKTLVGVHLTGESQVIQTGGQPIMEQYDFIARGTDEQLGNER
jgi:hypothetical protein